MRHFSTLFLLSLAASAGCASSHGAWYDQIDTTTPAFSYRWSNDRDGYERVISEKYAFLDKFTHAQLQPPIAREVAYEVLARTPTFAGPSVGSSPSIEGLCFRSLLRQPDAAQAFRALLTRADPPGKLYALCGLYLRDHASFEQVLPKYRSIPDPIIKSDGPTTFAGLPASCVIPEIESGYWPRTLADPQAPTFQTTTISSAPK